jgi:hypothetical protein
MPQAGFEPPNLASERPQTHALDRAPTGIGCPAVVIEKLDRNWLLDSHEASSSLFIIMNVKPQIHYLKTEVTV